MLTIKLIESCDNLADAETRDQADLAARQILETVNALAEAAEAIEESIMEFSQC